ncbi:MAG: metallophosphoesterase [Treponema sp.]|nr:metallophosphoesterase [Treponema sp.]
MVKYLTLIFFNILLIAAFSLCGCTIDTLGFFVSNDLDIRLKEKNNFRFLSSGDLTPSFGNEYSFIVLADTHIEDADAWGFENMEGLLAGNNEIKFVVVLGDITQSGRRQDIEKFMEITETFNVPCYPVIGNHDIYFDSWSVWQELIGSTMYKIDGADTTLFILDSANSFFGRQQLDWLEEEIKKTSGRIFVFTHSPLFVGSPVEMQQVTATAERARIVSILRNKCSIMFMGHAHSRYIFETNNVKFIAIEDFRSKKIYCIVSVNGTEVNYEFRRL